MRITEQRVEIEYSQTNSFSKKGQENSLEIIRIQLQCIRIITKNLWKKETRKR